MSEDKKDKKNKSVDAEQSRHGSIELISEDEVKKKHSADIKTTPVKTETTGPVKTETTGPVKTETTGPVKTETTGPVKTETTGPMTGMENISIIFKYLPGIINKIKMNGFASFTIPSIRKTLNISQDIDNDMIIKQLNDILKEKGIYAYTEYGFSNAITFKLLKDNKKEEKEEKEKIVKKININREDSYKNLMIFQTENVLDIRKSELKNFISTINSPDKIYELFRKLNYGDRILNISKRNITDFDFAKDEQNKVNNIYTIFSYEKDLNIFFIEVKTLTNNFIRYVTRIFDDKYNRFMLILTKDYTEIFFIFPDRKMIDVGKHKLKLTKLILKPNELHNYTDIDTISKIALSGKEKSFREVWFRWQNAFNISKVTDSFFEDYKKIFLIIRNIVIAQNIDIRKSHEYTLQLLNRIMFIYFISKKGWLSEPKFMKWLWNRYKYEVSNGNTKENTFHNWLNVIFFEAFNNKFVDRKEFPDDINKILLEAPYLNGNLFKKNNLDNLSIEFKDDLFKGIFEFLEKYNFTIKEDIPLDEEVAVDPQMIGYIYESLANVANFIYDEEDMRKNWGIFYTPKIEVDFMVRRSLVEYIAKNLVNISKDKIYQLVFDEKGTDQFSKIEEYFEKLWIELERILDNLSVVDPACGSGAFLVGMLNVMAELYKLIYKYLNKEIKDFDIKKKIIRRSLYGVDVMPWAIHAAELRLWLQLIVESDVKPKDLKKEPLLPNLDMNLRIGDSVVQEIGGVNLHMRDSNISDDMKNKLDILKQEKEKYFDNDPTTKFDKDTLFKEETKLFEEIIKNRISEYSNLRSSKQTTIFGSIIIDQKDESIGKDLMKLKDILKHITDTEKKPFIWDIDFAEVFGKKGGFDIVVGNPPYVRQENIVPPNKMKEEISDDDKKEYKEKLIRSVKAHFPVIESIDKKSDYYIYFYFTGLSILNKNGTFCFITSNAWLDVDYGRDLQEFLLRYVPIHAIYDSNKRVFEHAAINTIISLFGAPDLGNKKSITDFWR